MGKFKSFLINEQQIGLGNLGSKISDFYNNGWLDKQINKSFNVEDPPSPDKLSPEHGTGIDSIMMPTELKIPKIERSGRITTLHRHKNPIYVRLSDGTEAYFNFDEDQRIEGEPKLGKVMKIVFQRHPNDWTKNASKIERAEVMA